MTKSEELTSLISKKFFLDQYIYNDVYVKIGKQENEFCDCLMEFGNIYVCIQVKERCSNAESSSEKWFNNKVLRVAKKQIRDTFSYFKDDFNIIFSKTSNLSIDREKTLIPIIVFLNTDLCDYERIIYSKSLDIIINIFSYDDFSIMLKNLVIPYDILNYLSYRKVFKKSDRGKIIFDEVDEKATILFNPKDEKDYAEMFLLRTYYNDVISHKLNEEYVYAYNDIINQLNEMTGHIRCDFIEGLLKVNYLTANDIACNWFKQIEYVKEGAFKTPFIFNVEKRLYMFIAHPSKMSVGEFDIRLNLLLVYQRYKYSYEWAHIIVFGDEEGEAYSVSLCDINLLTEIPYESLLDKAINLFEKD